MKKVLFIFACTSLLFACSGPSDNEGDSSKEKKEEPKDEGKGVGEVKHVELNDPLDTEMIAKGKAIYQLKCAACHKLNDKRQVGPGWQGVTKKRKPEWIMNMITNVETMLSEDPEAQKLLEECLTRMPNQNVTVQDAREILEFMLENDSKG